AYPWLALLVAGEKGDVGAAVAAADDAEIEIACAEAIAGGLGHRLGLGQRCEQREAGRPPGRLADAENALALEPSQSVGNAGATVAAVLRRAEIIAEPLLDLAQRRRHRGEVVHRQSRQQAQQQHAAEPAGKRLGKSRQLAE